MPNHTFPHTLFLISAGMLTGFQNFDLASDGGIAPGYPGDAPFRQLRPAYPYHGWEGSADHVSARYMWCLQRATCRCSTTTWKLTRPFWGSPPHSRYSLARRTY